MHSRFHTGFFNYLTDRQHFVQIDSNIYNLLIKNFGVSQKSILKSIFFNLLVADMMNIWSKSQCIQYANNSTICRSCKITQKCFSEAEHKLHALEQWSQSTNLVFNSKKTKSMFFSTSNLLQYYQLYDDRVLTHFFSTHLFSTPWKHRKTLKFSDFFRG